VLRLDKIITNSSMVLKYKKICYEKGLINFTFRLSQSQGTAFEVEKLTLEKGLLLYRYIMCKAHRKYTVDKKNNQLCGLIVIHVKFNPLKVLQIQIAPQFQFEITQEQIYLDL